MPVQNTGSFIEHAESLSWNASGWRPSKLISKALSQHDIGLDPVNEFTTPGIRIRGDRNLGVSFPLNLYDLRALPLL
jgi:hypothetical protein